MSSYGVEIWISEMDQMLDGPDAFNERTIEDETDIYSDNNLDELFLHHLTKEN